MTVTKLKWNIPRQVASLIYQLTTKRKLIEARNILSTISLPLSLSCSIYSIGMNLARSIFLHYPNWTQYYHLSSYTLSGVSPLDFSSEL